MSFVNPRTYNPFPHYGVRKERLLLQEDLIHICINKQKLNEDQETIARTTIYGLSVHYDLEEMVRHWKTEFQCKGIILEHPVYTRVLQLQGDQRDNICHWLVKIGLARSEQLMVHGISS